MGLSGEQDGLRGLKKDKGCAVDLKGKKERAVGWVQYDKKAEECALI